MSPTDELPQHPATRDPGIHPRARSLRDAKASGDRQTEDLAAGFWRGAMLAALLRASTDSTDTDAMSHHPAPQEAFRTDR